MRHRDALGQAGRARGVDHVCEVLRLRARRRVLGGSRRDRVGVAIDAYDRCRGRGRRGQVLEQLRLGHEDADARLRELVRDAARRVREVDRHVARRRPS